MKKYLLLIALSLSFIISCGKKEKTFTRELMLKNIYKELILPKFNNFSEECNKLTQVIDSYASKPNQENLDTCRKHWVQVVLSWRHCDIYNVSDYQQSFIRSKIYTIFSEWTFNSQKDKLMNIKSLEKLGSTLKGISALEYLLFDEKLDRSKYLSYLSLVAK